jgi:hypothetical protein
MFSESRLRVRLTHGECIPVSCDPAARHPPEHFLPGRRSCAQRLLEDNLTRCVRHAITLQRSPKSKPIVGFCWEKFLLRFAAAVLTFFIAGLLYLMRFERVDNWGAYSLSGDRPSHPIWLHKLCWILGGSVIGANVGFELLVALQLEVAHHFIERFAFRSTGGFEPPCTVGATKTSKTLPLNPYQLPAHGCLFRANEY